MTFCFQKGSETIQRMVKNQLVRGLVDPLIQEQVLAQHATEDGVTMTLQKTINFMEAKESGKADASVLNRAGKLNELNRISDYRSGKNSALVTDRQDKLDNQKKCSWCGKPCHNAKDEESRKKECPAFGKKMWKVWKVKSFFCRL